MQRRARRYVWCCDLPRLSNHISSRVEHLVRKTTDTVVHLTATVKLGRQTRDLKEKTRSIYFFANSDLSKKMGNSPRAKSNRFLQGQAFGLKSIVFSMASPQFAHRGRVTLYGTGLNASFHIDALTKNWAINQYKLCQQNCPLREQRSKMDYIASGAPSHLIQPTCTNVSTKTIFFIAVREEVNGK